MIPVDGRDGFGRDPKTNAVILINKDEVTSRQKFKAARKKHEVERKQEIQNLKNEIGEIKEMLKLLLEKR